MSILISLWNTELGLCRQDGPGHTADVADLPSVLNGVQTAVQLCALALAGREELIHRWELVLGPRAD